MHYFFKWVEAEGFGNGGPTWVDDNVGKIQRPLIGIG